MQMTAGISQGASLQSLERLVVRKFVRTAEVGPRRRTELLLTAAGRRWLQAGCARLAESESTGDLDSLLRKALLIAIPQNGGKRAAQFLRAAAKSRRGTGKETPDPDSEMAEIAQLYSRFRQTRADVVVRAEADVLERAAAELARRASRKA